MTMVKICSDSDSLKNIWRITRDDTWWEATSVTIKVKTSLKLVQLVRDKSDHQLQRWQRVYQHPGVQQALVLLQLIKKHSCFLCISVGKY
jgi:hypothetical protein